MDISWHIVFGHGGKYDTIYKSGSDLDDLNHTIRRETKPWAEGFYASIKITHPTPLDQAAHFAALISDHDGPIPHYYQE
jgi:hypothetical protein